VFGSLVLMLCLSLHAAQGAEKAAPDTDAGPRGIPITVHLDQGSFVTVAIDDSRGNRVRNLIAETWLPAGENTVYWDGADDHGRMNSGAHGNYEIKGTLVSPGNYTARMLRRDKIDLVYEFTIYNPVNPPWRTPDTKGQWLADHTPPRCVLYLPGPQPQLLIGSAMAEGAHGLVWVDAEGVKLKGKSCFVGFAGAQALARDTRDGSVYAGAVWSTKLQIFRLDQDDKSVPAFEWNHVRSSSDVPNSGLGTTKLGALQGLAERNGLLVASLSDALLIIDAEKHGLLDEIKMDKPRGVAFSARGELLVLSGSKLVRYAPLDKAAYKRPDAPSTLIRNLDDPQGLAVAGNGDLYISLRGKSHQVKVFDGKGNFIRSIGKPGVPKSGPYDPLRMNNPNGLALTDDGRLWVAEEDFQPKRVSVWTARGDFIKAFYGPTEYGGGGVLDSADKRRFYYQGMEFAIDWEKGTSQLRSVFYRPEEQRYAGPGGKPELPIHLHGRQYMTNIYNSNPVGGPTVAGVWQLRDGVAVLVAAVGQANDWEVLKSPALLAAVPKGLDIKKPASRGPLPHRCPVLFAWSDTNANGRIDAGELSFTSGETGGLNVTPDLSFVTALTTVISPVRFTDTGVPVYDVSRAKTLVPDAQICRTSGSDQVVLGRDGSVALTVPPAPHPATGAMAGVTRDGRKWYYPSKWHGLHASQMAPAGRVPDPGELIGTTRVLGLPFRCKDSDAGEIWGINANSGVMYLFTTDGLFVSSLFTNGWIGNHGGPEAKRGMRINDMDSGGEGFWPTMVKTADDRVYLQAINHTSSIVRVDGLASVKRLPDVPVTVTPQMLTACGEHFLWADRNRIKRQGRKKLAVAMVRQPPVVDGKLDEWSGADWVAIDSMTYAAAAVSGDRLYVAFKTAHARLIENAGGTPWQALFKSGGGLDIMLAADPVTEQAGKTSGALRLLTAKVNGAHQSILYRPVAQGDKQPASFSSPWRTIEFDQVMEVSKDVEFAEGKGTVEVREPNAFGATSRPSAATTYEISVPLSLLGLKVKPGMALRGDLGVLIGNGTATEQRVYWSNKATTVVVDVPTEAMLTPELWGAWTLESEADLKEDFLSLPLGDRAAGTAQVGMLQIVPLLRSSRVLSIAPDCPLGQTVHSIAFVKEAFVNSKFHLPFPRPASGKGVAVRFDVRGGSWNFHTGIGFARGSAAIGPAVDFGPATREPGPGKTLEFRLTSGGPPKSILEMPFAFNAWQWVELRWMPLEGGRGGVSLLVGNSSKGPLPLAVIESVPDGFVLSPGYRLNYANFEVRTWENGNR
jgi:hypothetical protein